MNIHTLHRGGAPRAAAQPAQTPAQHHPDERLSRALQAARHAGYLEGERVFYVKGWRAGVFTGGLFGAGLGAVVVLALVELVRTFGSALGLV